MTLHEFRLIIRNIIKEDYRFEYKQTYKVPPHISKSVGKAKNIIDKNNLIEKYKNSLDKKIVTGEKRAAKLINGDLLSYNEIRSLRDLFVSIKEEYKSEKTKGNTLNNSAIIQIWELNGGKAAQEWVDNIINRHHDSSMKHKELRRGTGEKNRIGNTKNLMKSRLSRKPSVT